MASIYITDGTTIDYSIIDGRIRYFAEKGEILFDEKIDICMKPWIDKLWDIIIDHKMDIDCGQGLHAFVYPIKELKKGEI